VPYSESFGSVPARVANTVLRSGPRLGRVRLVAIDGPSGAGKSTFAASLCEEFARRCRTTALISTDHFATWDDPVAWWPRLAEGVLEPLARGEPGRYRRLDWTTGRPVLGQWVVVEPPEVLVLEGVSAGRASVRAALSLLCWVGGPDAATRLERAVQRDGETNRRNLQEWQAFERGWFAVDRTNRAVRPVRLVLTAQTGRLFDQK
jgi:uridine kinase